jgi:hypothetical protein
MYCQAHWSDIDKVAALERGEWVASTHGVVKGHVGFHLSSLYAPWVKWGDLVGKFIKNKDNTTELQDFINSELGEPWRQQIETVKDEVIYERQAEYEKGHRISEAPEYKDVITGEQTIIVTADVQKNHHWYVVREWADGGDSALIEWGYGVLLEDLAAIDKKYGANLVYIDNGYRERSFEVYEACVQWKWTPTIGSANIALPFKKRAVNPFEGKQGATANKLYLEEITFDANVFKSLLMDLIEGKQKAWRVYKGIEEDYVKQVMSEERVDGEWQKKRGHPNNHLWDTEVLQLMGATEQGIFRTKWMEE